MTLNFLNMPKKSIYRQFIPKKQFYDHNDLTSSEKNIFVKNIERISLYAQLTRANTNIAVYKDEQRTYEEISVFMLELRSKENLEKIVRIIMETIPYPIILVAKDLDSYSFYGAHQRDNLIDKNKIILEEMYHTDFMFKDNKFMQRIDYKQLNKMNFYQLYEDYIKQLIHYNLEKRNIKQVDNQAEVLAAIEEKEEHIQVLRNKLRKERHFNKKMELNMEIKKIEQKLKRMEDNDD